MAVEKIYHANVPVDPLQARYVALGRQIRELIAEQRGVKEAMRTGTCEVCGTTFSRARPTRRYCSQRCTLRAHQKRAIKTWNGDSIREALPMLKAGRLLTPQSLEIVELAVRDDISQGDIAEQRGLSRQRIAQVLGQAQKMASMALAMKAAIQTQHLI